MVAEGCGGRARAGGAALLFSRASTYSQQRRGPLLQHALAALRAANPRFSTYPLQLRATITIFTLTFYMYLLLDISVPVDTRLFGAPAVVERDPSTIDAYQHRYIRR